MKIVIGADHRGFSLKEQIKTYLSNKLTFVDVGCYSADSVDYPIISKEVVNALVDLSKQNNDEKIDNTFAIIICGSAIGVSIAVNRFSFIRGAIVFNESGAKSSRSHNNSNIICLPSDYITLEEAIAFIEIFISEKFVGERHARRVEQLSNLEDH